MPNPSPDGPSSHGFSHYAPIAKCPLRSALARKVEWPAVPGARGLANRQTPIELNFGTLVHTGLEWLYRTRCASGADNGEPDLDRAHGAMEAKTDELVREDPSLRGPDWDEAVARTHKMLDGYWAHHGPSGQDEFGSGELVVACDATGQPWVEREFHLELPDGTTYTAKTDLICWYHGALHAADHKTAAGTGNHMIGQAHLNGQFIGEFIQLAEAIQAQGGPEITGTLVNVLVKPRGKTTRMTPSQLYPRRASTYSPELCQGYLATVSQIGQYEADYDSEYRYWRNTGLTPLEAANRAYPKLGLLTGECHAYYRECQFAQNCTDPNTFAKIAYDMHRPDSQEDN